MRAARRLRLLLVVAVAFVLQHALLANLQIQGAQPDIMILVVVLTAMEGGPQRGAIVGFAVGLLNDLYLQSPFGLTALTLTMVGYAVGLLEPSLVDSPGWLTATIGAVASAAAVTLYALLYAILGHPTLLHHGLLAVVLVVGLVNGVLAIPCAPIIRWALGIREASMARRSRTDRWGAGIGR